MGEKLMDLLGLAYRQKMSIYRIPDVFRSVFADGFSFKRLSALFLAVIEMFGSVLFDGGVTPMGDKLDLSGYSLVFCDEFDGDRLDTDVWEFRRLGKDSGGYDSTSQVSVRDGKLVIKGEYRDDGEYGPGWYAADIQIKKKYKQGYFEIKCICNKGSDFWSAFWIQAEHPYDHVLSDGGTGGAELDIFESVSSKDPKLLKRGCIATTIHCNGFDDDPENIDSFSLGKFRGRKIYDEYNTYGLKWTEDEYIFYVNGVESARSSFAKGVSQVEEYVCVSLCIPGEVKRDRSDSCEFITDYVKIWQQPSVS